MFRIEPSDMVKDFAMTSPDIVVSSARYLISRGYNSVTAGNLGSLLDSNDDTGRKWLSAILKQYPDEWMADEEAIKPIS